MVLQIDIIWCQADLNHCVCRRSLFILAIWHGYSRRSPKCQWLIRVGLVGPKLFKVSWCLPYLVIQQHLALVREFQWVLREKRNRSSPAAFPVLERRSNGFTRTDLCRELKPDCIPKFIQKKTIAVILVLLSRNPPTTLRVRSVHLLLPPSFEPQCQRFCAWSHLVQNIAKSVCQRHEGVDDDGQVLRGTALNLQKET